jgi:hypothetical protein
MKRLYYKKKHVDIAGNWNELTQKQYIRIAKLLHEDNLSEAYSDDAKIIKALQILMRRSTLRFLLMDEDFIYRCLEYAVWVFTKENITTQLIPKYKGFYGPASEFDNLIGKEFHCTEIFYLDILETNSEESLDKLCAYLYRPKKHHYDMQLNKDGDCRIYFNPNECDYYTRKVSKWPLAVKQAILLWYDGCRQMLRRCYPLAFGKSKKTDNLSVGMFDVLVSISGPNFGTLETVENMFIHSIFSAIVKAKKDEIQLEKEARAQKQNA